MRFTLHLEDSCQRLRLRPGACIACRAGALWITLETGTAPRPSPDLVLAAGQRHCVTEAADYFLTSTRQGTVTAVEIDLSRERPRAGGLRQALAQWLHRPADPLRRRLQA